MLNLGQPTNETKRAIPLALLKLASDNEIQGITRFQKLVFLLQEGDLLNMDEISDDEKFDYKPHNYGPYSKELHDWLDELAKQGTIEREIKETPAGNEKEVYHWSDEGDDAIADTDILTDEDMSGRVSAVLDEFNSIPLLELLDEVYEAYPEYTINSKR
jgi:uncharacterized protein YwgA